MSALVIVGDDFAAVESDGVLAVTKYERIGFRPEFGITVRYAHATIAVGPFGSAADRDAAFGQLVRSLGLSVPSEGGEP